MAGIAGEHAKRVVDALGSRIAGGAARHARAASSTGLGAEAPTRAAVGLFLAGHLRFHLLGLHAGEEIEHMIVVAHVLETEVVILPDGTVALGGLVEAGL